MPGHDGIHGYWFKKFTSIYDRWATEMNRCLQETDEWKKERPHWYKKTLKKEPSPTTTDP